MTARLWRGVLLLAILGIQAKAGEPLAPRVEAVLKTPAYGSGHWGLLVVDAKTGKMIYEKNADELFCPASVTKLFSSAAALADLGADYRFKTPVVRRGAVDKEGVIDGDLILVASGDLSMGGRTGPEGTLLFEDDDHTYSGGNLKGVLVRSDPLAGLDQLAREVLASGVKAVSGDVLIDDRLFETASSTGSGPSRLSPILINDNVVDVEASPSARPGDRATVRLVPETAHVSADVLVETTESDKPPKLVVKAAGPRRFSVRGSIPVGHRPIVKIYEVEDPASFARTLFIETLRRRGVRVDAASVGDNRSAKLPSRAEVSNLPKVAEFASPPFRENLRVILKVSHNLHASTLPLLVAAHHGERTLADGLKREGMLLKELGVDPATISFGGGAGGARADLVTPRATVALLRALSTRSDFASIHAALPVLGRDGTLAKAVSPESPARGHVRAKTGTYSVENALTGNSVLTSKALAGYMGTVSGQPLMFAIFLNEVPMDASGEQVTEATAAAGRLLGRICEVLYTYDPAGETSTSAAASRN
jgi:D-alanyl-D-alanine carboxypeptidase/D-alanyl-D-alanine-endopeptidase (penicillin-binding protein 4)